MVSTLLKDYSRNIRLARARARALERAVPLSTLPTQPVGRGRGRERWETAGYEPFKACVCSLGTNRPYPLSLPPALHPYLSPRLKRLMTWWHQALCNMRLARDRARALPVRARGTIERDVFWQTYWPESTSLSR